MNSRAYIKAIPLAATAAALYLFPTHAHGAELLKNGGFSGDLAAWQCGGAAEKVKYSPGEGHTGAGLHVSLTPAPGDAAWSINLAQRNQEAAGANDDLKFTFWARSPQSLTIAAYVEESQAPYPKILASKDVRLTPEWQQFSFATKCNRPYAKGQLNLTFHLARGTGDIDLDDISLQNTPSATPAFVSNASLEHPVPVISNGDFSQQTANWNFNGGEKITREVIASDAPGQPKALRLHLNPAPDGSPYSITAYQRFNQPVNAGEVVRLSLLLRSPDKVRAGLVFEESREPYRKYANRLHRAEEAWQEVHTHFRAERNYVAGEMQITLHLGRDAGVLDIANVRVENLGTLTDAQYQQLGPAMDYFGGERHDDSWRTAALARIEKYRKADMQIRVVDAKGRPVPGATVHVQMKRHAFRFGQVVNPGVLLNPNADGDKYREILARDYNTAVFEGSMKWYAVEKNPDALRQNEECLKWLREHNFNVRGHCLIWGGKTLSPPRLFEEDVETARQDVTNHILDFTKRYQGQVYIWDVVNEAVTQGALWDRIGWDRFAEAYRTARQGAPDTQLAYNDYNISNELPDDGVQLQKVKAKIQQLIDAKVPLDVIGDQGHMSIPLTPIGRVVDIWDDFAKYGKKMEVTEFDLGLKDDAVQAQYITDYLTAAFAQPQMQAFVFWGFWENAHWRGQGGAALYTKDWTPRPAQLAYEKLVFKDWWTDSTLQTNTAGKVQTRGFLGDYDVTVTRDGKSEVVQKSLASDGLTLQVVLPGK